ncbi:hypothetical protein GBA63_22435 (plasmid) [Rubrobacter tropicus]|uniref:DUF2399 domain-containing protein n=1 Tax=Rubrobacter tropicus TaxID=2653851 RepID=A0A6G8QG83_9ACTN|nr:hypothetical protein [Rubrobacter tropicus]QIN85462.1 hypothetical protein GBA63_22435 [Rubrobacter tropicus]
MSGRPKGYAPWNPAPETLIVLAQVREVLEEYARYGAMTARQVFYRLVGQHGFPKSEKAYKRLCEHLVRARRAGLIPFHAIRDDGTTTLGGGGWSSPESFWRSVRSAAENFELSHQDGQPETVELWCEAQMMAGMLARMVSEWHVPVYSTGGFSSVTVTHEIAQRVARADAPTAFLHVGDHDPSGQSIFVSMAQDAGAFVAELVGALSDPADGRVEGFFHPERVALTRSQVEEYDLDTAPPKSTDSRSKRWAGETTQAEAMPPDLLQEVVRDAVYRHVDQFALDLTLTRERRQREGILEALDGAASTPEG